MSGATSTVQASQTACFSPHSSSGPSPEAHNKHYTLRIAFELIQTNCMLNSNKFEVALKKVTTREGIQVGNNDISLQAPHKTENT